VRELGLPLSAHRPIASISSRLYTFLVLRRHNEVTNTLASRETVQHLEQLSSLGIGLTMVRVSNADCISLRSDEIGEVYAPCSNFMSRDSSTLSAATREDQSAASISTGMKAMGHCQLVTCSLRAGH
jgi:hypothetical protein